MSDGEDKKTESRPKKTLTLKSSGVSQGTVRQNFSHGRSKSVVVETRKRRITLPGEAKPTVVLKRTSGTPTPATAPSSTPAKTEPAVPASAASTLGGLSASELDARRRALQQAEIQEIDNKKRKEEEAERDKEREIKLLKEREEEAKLQAEKEAAEQIKFEDEARVAPKSDVMEPEAILPDEIPAKTAAALGSEKKTKALKPFERKKTEETVRPAKPKSGEDRRRTKLTLSNALDEDRGKRGPSLAALRRRQEKAKRAASQQSGPREKISREVILPETITIQELAQRMSERGVDVVKFMMKQGQMLTHSDIVDADTAELIAEEFGHSVRRITESDIEEGIFDAPDEESDLQPRPPVVTIMGHVDHGKTSLLDSIRSANVVEGEAGGITQHIGAYQIEKDGQKISFIDTPGHAAFTAMRARGAQATDIAILVVAADDGVMPQTIESINHAKAADVPIIVAINKMDKPDVDPSRVRNELLQHEVFVESMGGEILEVEVSALKGTNIDKLLEVILLQAELLELKANPDRPAEGIVIEAELDKGRGPVATVLIQRGTLRVGDIIIAGDEWGRVRALFDDQGRKLAEALPSVPVEVLGLNNTPAAGDRVGVVDSEARAREISGNRYRIARDKVAASQAGSRGSLEQMMSQLQSSELDEAAVVVKGDVQGSVEAICGALDKLATEEVAARVVHSAVGAVTESDVALAAASNAPILAFNVRANRQARDAAEIEGIEIRYYSIIYDLVDDIKGVLSGMLAPERRETFLGYAEILEVFNVSKIGRVAGCMITEGRVERGIGVRLLRDNVVIHEGMLSTLKRFKDEVSEVTSGQECGMAFENYQDMRKGDVIECFRVEEIERSL
ncbi:MAG: translation initiation factor IF-2 [Hyphomicrobiales bacterium]|nr:translation initiation factor IF-2 [Hyphomicrobiales bacterium]